MSQWCRPLVFVFAVASMASLGCDRSDLRTPAAQGSPDFTFTPLPTAADVQRAVDLATAHPHAILLVHVDWAPMVFQRKRFAEFQRAYKARYPASDLEFRYIDCTAITQGYKPLRALPGWQELEESRGFSLVHGYGELVWCKNGRVLHVESPLDFDSVDALIAKTESLAMGGIAK